MSEVAGFEAMSVNGYPHKRGESGDWIPDEDARRAQLQREAEEQKRKDELVWACRSRICSEDEMLAIEQYGIQLFVVMNGGMSQGYQIEELERRFNDLLLQQFRLRQAADRKP